MTTAIQCVQLANGALGPAGQWLCNYDPLTGESGWSSSEDDALRFAGVKEAFEFWNQVLESDPIRPDGKPNKPLTAFTISIEPVPE
jgi:hypothetical protein